jgi:two-component system phosphate regulon sensor histidine kinase PhoR
MLLDELKSNILANISHELHTPLTVARSTLELLKDEDDIEKKNELIKNGIKALYRQNSVIENLLTAAHFEDKPENLRLATFEIGKILYPLIDEYKSVLHSKKMVMEMRIEKGIQGKIIADQERLRKVFRNLIDNAIKFNKQGGKVTIEAISEDKDIKVSVIDDCVGIPKEKINQVFNLFYQVDSSTKRRYRGTGMGLAVAKDNVDIHGDHISIESEEGVGTTVVVSLPIKREYIVTLPFEDEAPTKKPKSTKKKSINFFKIT